MPVRQLSPAESAQARLRAYTEIPRRAARLLAERKRLLAELERRYPRDVYTVDFIEQRRQEVIEAYTAKLDELRQEAAELERHIQRAVAATRAAERDPGREAAKARAWERYRSALSDTDVLTLVDLAARDPDPVVALETLAEELPAALRLAGRPEPDVTMVTAEIRRRLLPLLPDEQRQAAEVEAALPRASYRVGLALSYAAQALSGEWDDVPGLPDADGDGLIPITEE